MPDWLKRLVAGKELDELHARRTIAAQYRHYLAEFPDIALVLENMDTEASGTAVLNIGWPPSKIGPWSLENLREILRRKRAAD